MPLHLLLTLALQAPAQQTASVPTDPPAYATIPVAASPDFAKLVYKIQDAIASKDFDSAARLSKILPTNNLEFSWDTSNVPKASLAAFESAKNAAVANFEKDFPNVHVVMSPTSKRLKIDFENKLAVPPNSNFPAGSIAFYSDDPKDPWLETVIGLHRGNPLVPSNTNDVFNDVSRALGSAMGLATTPFYGGVMTGSDLPSPERYDFAMEQRFVVKSLVSLSDNLRSLIAKKISLPSGKPSLFVANPSVSGGEVFQGDMVPIAIQVTNNGDAPLSYSAKGDCGCIVVHEENVLVPGQSWVIRGVIDTRESKGALKKAVEIVTNDPEHPAMAIPVETMIKSRYELVPDFPDGLTADGIKPVKFGVTLTLTPGSKPFKVLQSAVVGLKGTVTQAEIKDSAGAVSGYRFEATIPTVLKGGPYIAELNLLTDDENLRVLRYPEHIVNGIVVLPGSLYLGSALEGKKDFRVDVIAPGVAFKIKSVSCSLASIKPTVIAIDKIGYKIKLSYDGTMASGPFDGRLRIQTDNPKQPSFEVPISGIAK